MSESKVKVGMTDFNLGDSSTHATQIYTLVAAVVEYRFAHVVSGLQSHEGRRLGENSQNDLESALKRPKSLRTKVGLR